MSVAHTWGLVLAGGEGNHLNALIPAADGAVTPQQPGRLDAPHTLIEAAIERARGLVTNQHICAVVTQQHRHWWSQIPELERLPGANLIVQPRDRGSAIAVLYSLLHILARDPLAQVVLLPSDHHVEDEWLLREAMMVGLAHIAADDERPVLLGIEPDESNTELGYILPGGDDSFGARNICRFIEKPSFALASDLIGEGALWNTFIIAATARSLVNLFMHRYATIALEMQVVVDRALSAAGPATAWPTIVELYQRLPELDFSRDVLEEQATALCVVAAPPCGWRDLGTRRHLADALRSGASLEGHLSQGTPINTAVEHARSERARAPDTGN